MLSPIKTPLFLLNVGPQRHLSQIAINAQAHVTRVHPHTKHLHLSNIKVVTQSNTSQKKISKFEPGFLLIVVSIVRVSVLRNMVLIGFTGEMNLVRDHYICSFLNFKEIIFCIKYPVHVPGSLPRVLVILRAAERRGRTCYCHFSLLLRISFPILLLNCT